MSWLDPPPLVEKRKTNIVLPPGADLQRIRRLSYGCALLGGIVAAILVGCVILLWWSKLSSFWPLVFVAFLGGIVLGFLMAARAIQAGLEYGRSQHKNQPPPQV